MLVLEGVLRVVDLGAGDLRLLHDVLDLSRGVRLAPLDDLVVQLAALRAGDSLDAGGAVLIVEVLEVEAQGLDAALVHAGAEGAEGDEGAFLALEQVVGLEGRGGVAAALGDGAGHGVAGVGAAHVLSHGLELGDVNDLALAGLLRAGVGGEGAEQGGEGGDIVVHVGLRNDGVAILEALQVQPAGEGLAYHVVGGAVADVGQAAELGVAEAGDVDDDELRVDLQQVLIVNAQLVEPDHVLHVDIGFLDEVVEQLLDLGVLQVELEGEAQLIAGVLGPGGGDLLAVDLGEGGEHTQGVADARTLDVDDLSAEVGQHGGAEGHGDEGAGADDAHTGKRAVLRNNILAIAHFLLSFLSLIIDYLALRALISSMSAGITFV